MTAQFTHHGGGLRAAAHEYGGQPEDWLDLSTGLNPVPWDPPPSLHIDWHRLPDPQALQHLESAAARHFGVHTRRVCAFAGSEAALRGLALLLAMPGRALAPAYRTHAEAFSRSRPIEFGGAPDADEVVVLANPNNPDGILRSAEAVLAWQDRVERAGGWLIVDEAFADCHPDVSVAGAVADGRRLVVLRSFGKFFGLAGLRLGFVIAPADLLNRVRAVAGAWPLHTAALALGRTAYAEEAWIARTRVDLAQRASALDAVLHSHGLPVSGACPLFRYITPCDAPTLFRRLAKACILTRPFADDHRALRLGVPGDRQALDRLDRALADG